MYLSLTLLTVAWASIPKPPASFAHLTTQDCGWGCFVGYDPATDALVDTAPGGEPEIGWTVLKIQDRQRHSYQVRFTPGPSDDPQFCLQVAGDWTASEADCVSGQQLYHSGDNIYIAGNANQCFTVRRKYHLQPHGWVEVKQPFLYVGLETTTNALATLTSEPGGGDEVATLPPGAPVTVLVDQGEHYLVATSFGLVGWVTQHEPQPFRGEPLEGIYFRGD